MMTKEELAEQRRLAYVLGRVSGNQAVRLIDEIERLQALIIKQSWCQMCGKATTQEEGET